MLYEIWSRCSAPYAIVQHYLFFMFKKNISENIGSIFANTQSNTLELKTFCK